MAQKKRSHSCYDLYDVAVFELVDFASLVAILCLSLQQFAFAWSYPPFDMHGMVCYHVAILSLYQR